MRILFLNAAYYLYGKDLFLQFLASYNKNVDIFCFQEYTFSEHARTVNYLSEYNPFFAEKNVLVGENFNLATYISKSLGPVTRSSVLQSEDTLGLGLSTTFKLGKETLSIMNIHGLSKPGSKLDTNNRVKQSKGFVDYYKKTKGVKIIGGDFNFFPNIKSYDLIKNKGYTELVIGTGVETTRNHLVWDKYPENPYMYSDYLFVSDSKAVKSFTVPKLVVSDHEPMVLELDL